MRGEEWLWARAPPRSRERGRRLRRGSVLPLASVRPERLGERPGAALRVPRTEMPASVSFPLILSPAQAAWGVGAGNRVGPGAQKDYEELDGAGTEFSLVPLRIPPLSRPVIPWQGDEPARESSQSPLSVGGCIYCYCYYCYYCRSAGAIQGIPVAVSARRAKEQKWRESVGVGTRPLQQGAGVLPLSPSSLPPPLGSPVHRGGPASRTVWLLLAVTVPGPSLGPPSEGTPWLDFQASDTVVHGVPLSCYTGWPVSQSYLHFLTC